MNLILYVEYSNGGKIMNDLVESAKKGDKEAFTSLIQTIQYDLYRIAQARLNDDYDINDAIQNTMINAYKHVKKLKDNTMFKSWVIKILINECNQIYASKKKKIELFNKLENNSINNVEENPFNKINSKIDFELILKNLNYKEKLIITLYYNSGYSCGEISDILGMKRNTVKSILTRTKEKIKKIYDKGGIYNG